MNADCVAGGRQAIKLPVFRRHCLAGHSSFELSWRPILGRVSVGSRLLGTPSTTNNTILVDNYDSYTYNLHHLITQTHGKEPLVILNDELDIKQISQLITELKIHSIVISPGPGHPDNPRDSGVCPDLFRSFPDLPILGVCLGHQILGSVYGGVVKRVGPVHGRLSAVDHKGHPLFQKIPSGNNFQAVRYHSLAVEEDSLPRQLVPIAWTSGVSHALKTDVYSHGERVLMGLAHARNPHYGVQFHPESVGSSFGAQLMRNFQRLTELRRLSFDEGSKSKTTCLQVDHNDRIRSKPLLGLSWRKIEARGIKSGDIDGLFDLFFGQNGFRDTFWLDSSAEDRCRFSFMGGPGGKEWKKVSYRLMEDGEGVAQATNADGSQIFRVGSFWDFLKMEMADFKLEIDPELPFDFVGGFVGYLGYELKAQTGGRLRHKSRHPDALMYFADQLIAIDHKLEDIYCIGLYRIGRDSDHQLCEEWIDLTEQKIGRYLSLLGDQNRSKGAPKWCWNGLEEFELDRSRSRYEDDIKACMEALVAGESYELCLTNKYRKKRGELEPREFYRLLRRSNPAPYAAWIQSGDDLTVCCSSPERLLRGNRDRSVEAKPIKGTSARSTDPKLDSEAAEALKRSEKDQAENLMIVDLLRNDLSRVCKPLSVHVPFLMEIESYSTVHQMVSTISGVLKDEASIVDAVKAVFPGGSMTGAPKIRSMEILDELEGGPRGIYSGSIGYFSVSGTFDMNIVIRTAVFSEDEIEIGCGGAIVLQSDPEKEFSELQLKARAVVETVKQNKAAGL